MARALISVPATAKRGEVIVLKTLISHKMETGFRYTSAGVHVPRDIITTFVARYDGAEIFRATLSPAIAANPYIAFHITAEETGPVAYTWTDDAGKVETVTAELTVA